MAVDNREILRDSRLSIINMKQIPCPRCKLGRMFRHETREGSRKMTEIICINCGHSIEEKTVGSYYQRLMIVNDGNE